MAETILAPRQCDESLGRKAGEEVLSDRSVEYLARVLGIAEEERDVGEQRVGDEVADRPGRGEDEVEAAILSVGDELAFAAECSGRENQDLVPTVGATFKVDGQSLGAGLEGRGFRLRVAEAQRCLGLRQRRQSSQAKGCDKRGQAHE